MLVAAELSRKCVRQRADSHLDAVAVFHQGGSVLADEHLGWSGFGKGCCNQRSVVLHQIVELVHIQEVSVCERHVGVHHTDHHVGRLNCGQAAVDGGSETHAAMLVRKGNVHEGGTEMDVAVAIELLALAKVDRQIVCPAALHVLPHVGTEEETLVEEDARVTLLAVGSGTFGVEVMEMQVAHVACISPPAQGLDKAVGNACDAGKVDMAAAFDMAYRLVGTYIGDSLHVQELSVYKDSHFWDMGNL